jgi:hypothetical protein
MQFCAQPHFLCIRDDAVWNLSRGKCFLGKFQTSHIYTWEENTHNQHNDLKKGIHRQKTTCSGSSRCPATDVKASLDLLLCRGCICLWLYTNALHDPWRCLRTQDLWPYKTSGAHPGWAAERGSWGHGGCTPHRQLTAASEELRSRCPGVLGRH